MTHPLHPIVTAPPVLAIAVSGGVDSLTLAVAAHRWRGGEGVTACHAVSPAVPPTATERVRDHAAREGMRLVILDAGEFADPDYRRNPVNRCFYCKTSLYRTVTAAVGAGVVVASGTNTDDLGDYRPGLAAARDHGVVHPYVEAGMDKAAVRALARDLALGAVADLPAAPCLSSRVETGLAIDPAQLALVDAVEQAARAALGPVTLRCRVRAAGLVLEVEDAVLASLVEPDRRRLADTVAGVAQAAVRLEPYRKGSAFLHAS